MAKSNLTITVELSEPANRTLTLLVQAVILLLEDRGGAEWLQIRLTEAAKDSGHLFLPEQKDPTL